MVHPDNMDCYSALKRNELPGYEEMWRDLECLSLSDRSHLKRLRASGPNSMASWKRSTVAFQGAVWRGEQAGQGGCSGQWDYSVGCYSSGYATFHVCQTHRMVSRVSLMSALASGGEDVSVKGLSCDRSTLGVWVCVLIVGGGAAMHAWR